jgi:D-3-phosphoglycerate dehydrogenase
MPYFRIVTPDLPPGDPNADERAPLAGLDAVLEAVPETNFPAAIRTADAVYPKSIRLTEALIATLERCRVIVSNGVGVDHIAVAAATARGIPVTNVPHVFIEEVAEHALALLLAANRGIIAQDRLVRDGRWAEGRPIQLHTPRLLGQTLGLIGFGHIARAVAARAKAFGLHLLAHDPYIEELVILRHGAHPATLDEVLSRSDYVSLHIPGSAGPAARLTDRHFALMKPAAVLINTARGAMVDESALIRALEQGRIAHAALDVLEQEPPGHNNPLLSMPNVTLSAHTASASARSDRARRSHVGRELALVAQGRWPTSCVNPAVLERGPLRRWQPIAMTRGPNS